MGVLAVQVDQRGAEFGQRAHRGQPAVDVRPRPTIARHYATKHVFIVADDETPLDHGLGCATPNDVGLGPSAHQQIDGLDQHRLAGARLTREGGHAGAEEQRARFDDAEIRDGQLDEHVQTFRDDRECFAV